MHCQKRSSRQRLELSGHSRCLMHEGIADMMCCYDNILQWAGLSLQTSLRTVERHGTWQGLSVVVQDVHSEYSCFAPQRSKSNRVDQSPHGFLTEITPIEPPSTVDESMAWTHMRTLTVLWYTSNIVNLVLQIAPKFNLGSQSTSIASTQPYKYDNARSHMGIAF